MFEQILLFGALQSDIDKKNVEKVNISKLPKVYYNISEVANLFSVNASLLRFWEKEFSDLQPKKNKKGDRFYNKQQIQILNKIYYLVKEKKLTIAGAKVYLKQNKIKSNDEIEQIENLKKIKEFLIALKNSIDTK